MAAKRRDVPILLKKPDLGERWGKAGLSPEVAAAAGSVSACCDRLWHRDQSRQLPEVLGGGGEEEFVTGAAGSSRRRKPTFAGFSPARLSYNADFAGLNDL